MKEKHLCTENMNILGNFTQELGTGSSSCGKLRVMFLYKKLVTGIMATKSFETLVATMFEKC